MTEKDEMWHNRYMELAKVVSTWTSCLSRAVGCVITKGRRVMTTGYNGAPAGVVSCREEGICLRKGSPSGHNLEVCKATHAEMNAITQAAKFGTSIEGGDLYVTTYPCVSCMKSIINAGIKRVFYWDEYDSPLTQTLANAAGVKLICLKK